MINPWRVWTPGQPLVKKGAGNPSDPVFPELDRCDALVQACLENDARKVRELLDSGVSPDILLWGQSSSLLAQTIGRKRFAAAHALLDAGADPMFPVSRHAEFVVEHASSDMAHRLAEATHALGRVKDDRNWRWAEKLLEYASFQQPFPGLDEEDDLVLEQWKNLGVGLVVKRAPPSTLRTYLEKVDGFGIVPDYRGIFLALPDMIKPDRGAFDEVFRDCCRKADAPEVLSQAITESLREEVGLEYPVSGAPSASRPLQGVGLGWLIAAWVEVDGPGEELTRWAVRAATQGQGRLLEKTLLPLIFQANLEGRLLDSLAFTALSSGRHPDQVFRALDKHWGSEKVDEALNRLDRGIGEAWRLWLSGKAMSPTSGGSPLTSAKRLARAGVLVPQHSDRSFLEDCFSIGVAMVHAYAGPEGCEILDLLIEMGAAPLQPNLQNKTPLDILEQADEKWGRLEHIKTHLASLKMSAELPEAASSSSAPSRSPRF